MKLEVWLEVWSQMQETSNLLREDHFIISSGSLDCLYEILYV